MAVKIPTIDLEESKISNKVIQDICDAAASIGFLHIVNHGISSELINNVFNISSTFFQTTPIEEKRKFSIDSSNFGWTNIGVEKLDEREKFGPVRSGDLKESFNFGKLGLNHFHQILPNVFVKERATLEKFERECHRVCMNVLHVLAKALQLSDNDWFVKRHVYDEKSGDILRLLWYPEFRGNPDKPHDSLPAKRCSEHSDYGSITALFQHDIGGLQVLSPDTSTGYQWIDVPVVNNAILINFGDQLQFWTGGKIKSTIHRVNFDERKSYPERFSIAYFCHANDNVILSPFNGLLSGENGQHDEGLLTAGEHLAQRLQNTYTYEKAI